MLHICVLHFWVYTDNVGPIMRRSAVGKSSATKSDQLEDMDEEQEQGWVIEM